MYRSRFRSTFGFIYFWKAKQDKISYYKLDVIASSLGKRVFQKKDDLILNAFQLENGTVENESTVLANSYIEEISQKLKSVNLNDYFKENKFNQIKSILLIVWTGIISVFFLNYESSSNAFLRMINPDKVFYAPKPFSLLSMSGDIHIIGGEKTDIYIQSYPDVPDTLTLKLTPSQVSTQSEIHWC